METGYRDRHDAGKRLAKLLSAYAHHPDVLTLALPRGGVPVAYEVARALKVPLDVFTVRKLGVPGHEEFAMGAIASGGMRVLNNDALRALHIPERVVEEVVTREQRELERREQLYRDGRPPPDVRGRTVILIDDGLATGATMRAALRALREQQPARLIVAVPVAAPPTCLELLDEADDVICAFTPDPFFAVGLWYQNFEQTSDQEVHDLLAQTAQEQQTHPRNASLPFSG
jgi:putative phosphoribosyl transferase